MAASCILRWRFRRFLLTSSMSVVREMKSDVVLSMGWRLTIHISLLIEASWRLPNRSVAVL